MPIILICALGFRGGEIKAEVRVSGPEPRREFAKIESQPNFNVSVLSVEDQIRTTLRIEGLEHLSDTFIKVAFYESTLNPNARGYAGPYYGLFQIYTGTWNGYGCEGDIFNAMHNTACAVKIYRAEGLTPWEVYTDGLI